MINSSNRNFRQIGAWFQDSQINWNLIDQHGGKLIQFDNIEGIKNDMKILDKIAKLWQAYMSPENAFAAIDSNNAIQHARNLLKRFEQNESKDSIDRAM